MANYADGRISRKHLNNSKLKERLTCHQNLPTLIYDTRPTCKNIVTLPRCLMHKNNNNMSQQPASQPVVSVLSWMGASWSVHCPKVMFACGGTQSETGVDEGSFTMQ